MVPAPSRRVFAQCAMSVPKSKVMSTPAFGRAERTAVQVHDERQVHARIDPASPSSSGVTATGENAVDGFDW